MRYRVDFEYGGYASYDATDREKAYAIFKERGIRFLKQRDIHDRGILIEGTPIFEDNTREPWNEN